MSVFAELEDFGRRIGADVERLLDEGKRELEQHALDHPQPLFALLRTLKPVLRVHGIAIVTRYPDVVEVLTNDEAFGVEPYTGKMQALAGAFVLGLDDCAEYERDISILRLAAPRADLPKLAGFVHETAEQLVQEAVDSTGRVEVPELAKRVPARLFARWFGVAGDEDALIARTLAMFEDIFANLKNDPQIHADAEHAAAPLRTYLTDALAAHRASSDRTAAGETVLGRLISMQSNPHTAFTDEQIVTNVIGLVVGFIPTVATATTFAIDALLDRPRALAEAQAAAAGGDGDAVRAHMWEAMRLAPQGPGLLRRARNDFVVAAGTMHATEIPAGTITFAATQSAMLDGRVIADPEDFRADRPARDYLHFGAGLHECFGRFANAMQIPAIATALLRHGQLARVDGNAGRLTKSGPYPASLAVTL